MSAGKQVVLRFVFKGGDALQTMMGEAEARDFVRRFAAGDLKGRLSDHTGWWAVDVAEVAGLHYLEVPSGPTAVGGPVVPYVPPSALFDRSGRN